MNNEIGLHFGAMADSVKEQLEKQGYTLPREALFDQYDKMMFAYNMLRIHSMLTQAEAEKVAKRILKNIAADAVQIEEKQ